MGLLNPAFTMECQRQSNWCWAAVTKSVKQYASPQRSEQQCEIATKVLGPGVDCCNSPAKYNCTHSLKDALEKSGQLLLFLDAQTTFETIEKQINRNKPVCARIVWDVNDDGIEDGAHFVVIAGCENPGPTGVPWITVKDPDGGQAGYGGSLESDVYEMTFADFRSHYRLAGTWYQTYLTR